MEGKVAAAYQRPYAESPAAAAAVIATMEKCDFQKLLNKVGSLPYGVCMGKHACVRACMHACVRARVRACVCACVRACARARAGLAAVLYFACPRTKERNNVSHLNLLTVH